MPWKQGESGNPNGRAKGTANRILTLAFKQILEIEGNEPSEGLVNLLRPLFDVARDPDHKDFMAAQGKILKYLQAELRHELSDDEQQGLGGLLALLQELGTARGERSEDVERAAE